MSPKFLYITILVLLFSCAKESHQNINFYHWKSKANYSESYEKVLDKAQSETLYIHYFDVNIPDQKSNQWTTNDISPNYVIREIDDQFKQLEIIPVIYITNRVFKTTQLDIGLLSDKITKLIHQISLKHFNKKIYNIQIDCDWTQSTRNAYFELLKTVKHEFEIDVTIRLHQIKFKNRTGVPPVNNGTLMVYNVGDLKNKQENSILENRIVESYIDEETSYPLKLNIGLPLFSQTIVTNKDNKIKIIKNTERKMLESDLHFKGIDNMNFEVIKDTLYKGFYLTKGYNLKLEQLKESEVIDSYKTIKNSNLETKDIIFYHLDDDVLSNISFDKIMNEL